MYKPAVAITTAQPMSSPSVHHPNLTSLILSVTLFFECQTGVAQFNYCVGVSLVFLVVVFGSQTWSATIDLQLFWRVTPELVSATSESVSSQCPQTW